MSTDLLIAVVLIGLAAYRLWRIIGRDQIGDPVRVWLIRRQGRGWTFLDDLLSCAFCAGWWLAGVMAVLVLWGQPWLHVGLVWCGGSAVAGVLGEIDEVLSRKAERRDP